MKRCGPGRKFVNKSFQLFFTETDNNKIPKRLLMIQRLNLCRDSSYFNRFDTVAERSIGRNWTAKSIYPK